MIMKYLNSFVYKWKLVDSSMNMYTSRRQVKEHQFQTIVYMCQYRKIKNSDSKFKEKALKATDPSNFDPISSSDG